MITVEPVRIRTNDKLFSILRHVRSNSEEFVLQLKHEMTEDLETELTVIRPNSDQELWYICREIKDAEYRDIDPNELHDSENNLVTEK
jgi:hypothetical protein